MKFLITILLIAIAWIMAEMTLVEAERRTFDFLKKHHHHHHKHRKEDHNEHYLDESDFDNNYHDSHLHNHGTHYPSVHIYHHNSYGLSNGYGIGESGFHGGVIHSSGIQHGSNSHLGHFYSGYIGGNHFGSGIFDGGLEKNLIGVQDEGVYGDFGEVHDFVGNHHGSHLSHFG